MSSPLAHGNGGVHLSILGTVGGEVGGAAGHGDADILDIVRMIPLYGDAGAGFGNVKAVVGFLCVGHVVSQVAPCRSPDIPVQDQAGEPGRRRGLRIVIGGGGNIGIYIEEAVDVLRPAGGADGNVQVAAVPENGLGRCRNSVIPGLQIVPVGR